jgi:hypothetical protein
MVHGDGMAAQGHPNANIEASGGVTAANEASTSGSTALSDNVMDLFVGSPGLGNKTPEYQVDLTLAKILLELDARGQKVFVYAANSISLIHSNMFATFCPQLIASTGLFEAVIFVFFKQL